jgi:hypothetical protein
VQEADVFSCTIAMFYKTADGYCRGAQSWGPGRLGTLSFVWWRLCGCHPLAPRIIRLFLDQGFSDFSFNRVPAGAVSLFQDAGFRDVSQVAGFKTANRRNNNAVGTWALAFAAFSLTR